MAAVYWWARVTTEAVREGPVCIVHLLRLACCAGFVQAQAAWLREASGARGRLCNSELSPLNRPP